MGNMGLSKLLISNRNNETRCEDEGQKSILLKKEDGNIFAKFVTIIGRL